MGFLKSLLGIGGDADTSKENENHRQFDTLKYDGVRALRLGQLDIAVNCLEHALQLKDDLEVHDYLSQAYIHQGDLEKAYQSLNRLAEAQPDNEQIYLRMASVAYMREDYLAEEDVAKKALGVNADSAPAHYLLAQAYIGEKQDILAIAMLTKALALDEKLLSARLLRGETLLRMGDVQGAAADAEVLMQKVADNEDALLLAARVARARGDLDAAIGFYDRMTEANPFSAVALRERGTAKFAKGDKEGAEADGRAALELEPEQVASVSGDYTARGTEDVQRCVSRAQNENTTQKS